jgi:hypothetical protein
MTEIEIKTEVRRLTKEMNFLAARRLMKPSVEDSRRMYQIFSELYELTGDKKYLL